MKSDRALPVAIIGGGFSGTIIAAQLARRGIASVLIDGSGRAGKGVAYSTTEPAHLLNVPAEAMSAWADDPDHFARRFEAEGGDRRGFAQRRLFARYLGDILDEAMASGASRGAGRDGDAEQTRHDGGWLVDLDDGSNNRGRGARACRRQSGTGAAQCVRRRRRALRQRPVGRDRAGRHTQLAASGDSVLLVGTGLTMVDLCFRSMRRGIAGKIVALSRRGLIPRSHADFEPAPVEAARGAERRFARPLALAAAAKR